MTVRRPMVMGDDGFVRVLPPGDTLVTAGGLVSANSTIPAGNTVTATTETAFSSRVTIPAGMLAPGARLRLLQFGLYTSSGVAPNITPRIRLAGTALLPVRAIMGLVAATNAPWQADADFLATDAGLVGSGILTIDDNQVRIFGGPPITGLDLTKAAELTSSAQWGQTGCSITCQAWIASVTLPTA